MLTGTPGKVAFIFPHSLLTRISDQGHKYWLAFYRNSAFSFKFSSMILPLSLGAFYFSFSVCSTCLSQNASFLATKRGRMDYTLSLKSKLSPRWKWVQPSQPSLDLARFLERRAPSVFCSKLPWWIVPWSTQRRVHGVLRYRQHLWKIINCTSLFRNLKYSWKCFASNKHAIFIKLRKKCFE